MNEICRTCLQEITDNSLIFHLDSKTTPITIRSKLTRCVPELDLNLVPNPVICNSCLESLNSAHEFKNKCLEAEARIQNYIRQEGYMLSTCIDLKRVVQHKEEPPPSVYKDFAPYFEPEASIKPLDITNLQCNTQELFAVPKIAQLLAGDSPSSFKCKQCAYTATNDTDLKNHEKTTHVSGTKYQHRCTECDYSAPKKQTLIIHMRKHDKEKSFHCTVCNYGTPYRNLLVQHLRTQHTGEKPYKCGLCDFTSIYISALNKHIKTIHADDEEMKLCDYKERLSTHVKISTAKKCYKCLLCEYSTSHKTNLVYHMRLHTGTEKLYKCKVCDYKAVSKSHLRKHLKTQHVIEEGTSSKCNQCESCIKKHKEEHQYVCTFCNYKSSTNINLIEHLTTHSDTDPYHCLNCGYRTATKTDLQKHQANVHEKQETGTCVICQKKFNNVESLKGHVKFHEDVANSIRDDRNSSRDPAIDSSSFPFKSITKSIAD